MTTIIFQQTEEKARKLKEGETGRYIGAYGLLIYTQGKGISDGHYFPGILKEIETPKKTEGWSYYVYNGKGGTESGNILIPRPKVKKYKWYNTINDIDITTSLHYSEQEIHDKAINLGWRKVPGSEVEE